MATILNDRDKALQAAPYRSNLAAVTISGTAASFLASKNTTTITPATITLTATPAGSVYTALAVYTWAYALSSAPNTWVALGAGANLKTQVLNNTNSWVANASIQYRCVVTEALLDTSYAYYTVTYAKEASELVVVNLSRNNVLVTCDSTGTPTSYSNTNQVITVSRGTSSLNYNVSAAIAAGAFVVGNSYTITTVGTTNFTLIGASVNTVGTVFIASGVGIGTGTAVKNSADTFTVSYVATSLTAAAGTGSGTTWTQPIITAITLDGATIEYTIKVFDSATVPAATTYTKTVVYNKVNNGVIGAPGAAGADGANLYPVANYDFIGALPSGVTFPGTVTDLDSSTATTIQNTVADQNLRLTNLNLVPANSYIISMRVKLISGTWEGTIYPSNLGHGESGSYYKTIPQPAVGVWTTINVDMRTLTVGTTNYMTGGNVSQLRFDFINDITSQVAIDYITVGKYGVAEATKSITLSMYQWATSAPAYTGPFTYTWNTGAISAFPANWTSAAGTAPGNGYTLYQRNIILIDAGTVTTTDANWSSSTINTIGYRNDGSVGVQGDSARTAYVVTREVWTTPVAPTASGILAPTIAITITGTTVTTNVATISVPLPIIVGTKLTLASGTNFGGLANTGIYYVKTIVSATQVVLSSSADLATVVVLTTATGSLIGTTNSWSLTATGTLTDGQYMYQADGILNNSTNIIAWGTPYLSNLKVGNLSAISANLGVVEIASGGSLYSGKTSYADTSSSGFFLGNESGYAKFRIGTADNSSSLGYDSSTGVLTLKGGSYLNNTGTTLFTATTVPADIQNSAISLSSAGVLSGGAADSAVTLAGIAPLIDPAANKTSVDANGAIQGVSSGAGTSVSNALVETLSFSSSSNMLVNGNTLTKSTVAAAAWDAQVYSKDSYIGGAYVKFIPLQVDTNIMVGLNIDPTTDASYVGIDYAWYLDAGTLRIYETGVEVAIAGGATYLVSDVLSITYDGSKVSYYKNGGTAIRTVAVSITGAIYFDSSFNQDRASIGKVDFGPLTSNAWAAIGGTGKPADNATVGATIDNMTVATGANLVTNSDFSSGISNWTIDSNVLVPAATIGTNFSAATTLNNGIGESTNTLYIQHAGTNTATVSNTVIASDYIPISWGKRYVASAYVTGQNCTITIGIYFYNSANVQVTGTSSGYTYGTTTVTPNIFSSYTRKTAAVTASYSTIRSMRIVITKSNTAVGSTSSSAYVVRTMIQEAGTIADVAGPWALAGVGKVVVNSISTAAIAAGTAQTTANTANDAAGTAQTTANTANDAAGTAQTTANTANAAAATAQTTANTANAAANAATTALTNKLNKSAADTMTGPITLNAENAITVGTPALDGVTGKNGFYIGSNGIIATKNGAATVSISNTGDATFKGTVEASVLQSSDGFFKIDLINKTISISV